MIALVGLNLLVLVASPEARGYVGVRLVAASIGAHAAAAVGLALGWRAVRRFERER